MALVLAQRPVQQRLVPAPAELLGARTTLALSGLLGAFTLAFLFVPGVRDPERKPLAATVP